MDPAEQAERKRHRRDLPEVSRNLSILIDKLEAWAAAHVEDLAWQSKWRDAVAKNPDPFQQWVNAKTGRKLKDILPSRRNWVRLFNLDPGEHYISHKYLLHLDEGLDDQPLRKSFDGLSFNQVEEVSRILVQHFGYATKELMPVLADARTWDSVINAAIVAVTDEPAGSVRGAPAGAAQEETRRETDESVLPDSNIQVGTPTCFVGREEILEAIESAFQDEPHRVVTVALHGLRGVGKTVVAATYAQDRRTKFRATWWVNAETERTIRESLFALGLRMGWVTTNQTRDNGVGAVMAKLSDAVDGFLLIFDNALDAKMVRRFFPRAGQCKILVTSTWDAWRGQAHVIDVPAWQPEAGADFLMERTPGPHSRSEAVALASELGGLPLALEQAGAYCEEFAISFSEYTQRFVAKKMEFLDAREYAPEDYGLTVAATFGIAIDEATKRHAAAEPLIVHAALLGPYAVPLFPFTEAHDAFVEPLGSAVAAGELDEIVRALRVFALVSRERIESDRGPSTATDSIRMHRLVREVAAARVGELQRREIRERLLRVLDRLYPADPQSDATPWVKCEALTEHLLSLWQEGVSAGLNPMDWPKLLDRVLAYFQAIGAYREAELLAGTMVTLTESALGPMHPDVATALVNEAASYMDHGNLRKARPPLERALKIREALLPPDHPMMADVLDRYGTLLSMEGNTKEALPLLDHAVIIKEKALGPDHPKLAPTLSNFAEALERSGEIKQAIECLRRALAIHEKASLHNLGTALIHNNLGKMLLYRNKDEAAVHLNHALSMFESMAGPEHPLVVMTLNNLGSLSCMNGKYEEAETQLYRALSIASRVCPPGDVSLGYVLANLALVQFRSGKGIWRSALKLAIGNFRNAGMGEVWLLHAAHWVLMVAWLVYYSLKLALMVGVPIGFLLWVIWSLASWI